MLLLFDDDDVEVDIDGIMICYEWLIDKIFVDYWYIFIILL